MPEKIECIRCGVCCVSACCEWGRENADHGLCSALVIHKEGHTSCKAIVKLGNPFSKGCPLREFEEGFKIIREYAEEKAGVKLPGMNQAGGT